MATKRPPRRKNLREKERRATILDAAKRVFSTKGYRNATMEDIMEEVGCSRTLIYRYWKSKGSLFKELINDLSTLYIEQFDGILQSKEAYRAKLNRFFWKLSELLSKYEESNRLVHSGSYYGSRSPEENFGAHYKRFLDRIQEQIELLFGQGVESGFFRKDLDVEAIAYFLICSAEGYIYMSILGYDMPVERAEGNIWRNHIIPCIVAKD